MSCSVSNRWRASPGETRGQPVMSLAAVPCPPAVPDPPSEVQEIAANVSSTQSAM
ncbi:hypothetical protein ACVW00_003596 [Marmoricola sp. URHA0025 HA25]